MIQWVSILILAVYATAVTVVAVRQTNGALMRLVMAFNALGSQPIAIMVLIIGCTMIIACRVYGVDTTIAGGVIGCAVNMLTSQVNRVNRTEVSPDAIKVLGAQQGGS